MREMHQIRTAGTYTTGYGYRVGNEQMTMMGYFPAQTTDNKRINTF